VVLERVLHGLVEHLEWEEEVEGPDEDQNKGKKPHPLVWG